MRIFLEPTEPLLFRTGRPFEAGESTFASSLFPPTPETLQGAIRAALAAHWDTTKSIEEVFLDKGLTSLIGRRGGGYGRFRVSGIAIGRRKDTSVERIFKAPAHLITIEEKENKERMLLKPKKVSEMKVKSSDLTDAGYFLFPMEEREGKREPFDYWLTESGLERVLRYDLQLSHDEIVRTEEMYQRESRLGIAMDNSRKTTQDGFLYQTQVVRMQPGYGFVVDIRLRNPKPQDDIPYQESLLDDEQTRSALHFLPDNGWVMLGGDRRTARFEVIASSTGGLEQKKQGNLLYLATPASYDAGWLPSRLAVRPITAAIDRYESVGGWELNPENGGGSNKIMRRCVPAGSVYFFNENVDVTQPLTDEGMEIGYGITYTGEWQS